MKKWKLESSKPIFESKWLTLKNNSYKLPNGDILENYLHIDRFSCVVIVAEYDEKIVVVKQYRRGVDEVLYELPAGLIDTEESILETAERELEEETGFVGKAKFLSSCATQPAFVSMKTNFVFVKVESKNEQKLQGDEQIEVTLMNVEQINKMIVNNEITDLSFIAGMHLYNLFKNKDD